MYNAYIQFSTAEDNLFKHSIKRETTMENTNANNPFSQKQFKEIFAKNFIHRFISREYWDLKENGAEVDADTEAELGLKLFTPALFGFKSDTPYLDLLNAFLFGDENYEYDDCQDNWLFLKNEDGSDYVDENGRKRTLLDFTYEDDLYIGYEWNEHTLWRAMRDHYDTAESTINAVMQYLKTEQKKPLA